MFAAFFILVLDETVTRVGTGRRLRVLLRKQLQVGWHCVTSND